MKFQKVQHIKFYWAVVFSRCNMLDGLTEHFCLYDWQDRERGILLFDTKKKAENYRKQRYGYIARRPDLQREPHGWTPGKVVRVFMHIGELYARKRPKRYRRTLKARANARKS